MSKRSIVLQNKCKCGKKMLPEFLLFKKKLVSSFILLVLRCYDFVLTYFEFQCDLGKPCDENVQCQNTVPGYRCGPCPPGFTGSTGTQGFGLEEAERKRERCYDIDECADGRNGGCVPNSECINIEGSFRCGSCHPGYTGNQTVGCHRGENMCPDGSQCHQNAYCIYNGNQRYKCYCKMGSAGNGKECGHDRDLDSWPDYDLSCSDPHCKKVAALHPRWFFLDISI